MKKIVSLIILGLLSLASCKGPAISGKRMIMVTIEPLRYFTEQIAGDKFKVETMVRPGYSPEDYEPTPKQMVELSHTLLYIKVGYIGFEQTWMNRLKKTAPQLKIIDTSKGIRRIYSAPGIPDPHTWMSCKNARIIALNIYQALVKEDPRDKALFQKNLEKLLKTIGQTDKSVRQILAHNSEKKSKAFVIYHPVLTYFANEYHLIQLPMEQEGREPSTKEMQELILRAKQLHVKTIYIQQQFSPRDAMAIAFVTKGQPENIEPLNYNWNQEMLLIARLFR